MSFQRLNMSWRLHFQSTRDPLLDEPFWSNRSIKPPFLYCTVHKLRKTKLSEDVKGWKTASHGGYLFIYVIYFFENPFFFIFRTHCLAITKTSRRVIIEINSLRSSWTFDSFLYKLYFGNFLEIRDVRFATIVTSGKMTLFAARLWPIPAVLFQSIS